MLIGVDAIQLCRHQKGIGRVERSIIQVLAASQSHAHHFVVFLDRDHTSLGLPVCPAVNYAVASAGSLFVWEQFQLPRLARRFQVDSLLSFSDRIPLALVSCVVLYLFEIPDHRRELALSAKGVDVYQRASDMVTQLLFPCTLKRAKRIAVASHATERDLRTRYRLPDRKISVVPAAADPRFRPQPDILQRGMVSKRFGAGDGYVLHFSSGDPRENTPLALRAFAQAEIPPVMKMILVGSGALEQEHVSDTVDALALSERVVLLGHVSESDLVDLYQAADVYIDPSLFEGFGLQVLEAMACGVPVVCSNTTSLPEIVRDTAITCDPDDVAAFAAGLEVVLNNHERASVMRAAGLMRASQFSWQRTTRELVQLCERAVA